MYTEDYIVSLQACSHYKEWINYVRAKVLTTARLFAPAIYQLMESGSRDTPLLPMLIVLDKLEKQWQVYTTYPAKEIPNLIATTDFCPPTPRVDSWKKEQHLLAERDEDPMGWYNSHLPDSHRHLAGAVISDSSTRLNDKSHPDLGPQGNSTFTLIMRKNGQMTKLEEYMSDGTGLQFAINSIHKDNARCWRTFRNERENTIEQKQKGHLKKKVIN